MERRDGVPDADPSGPRAPRVLFATTVSKTLRAFLLPLAQHLREKGWRVDGLAHDVTSCDRCQSTFDHVWEIEWSRNPLSPRNLLLTPRLLRGLVIAEDFDLVHVHTPVAGFITRLTLRRLRGQRGLLVVYTAHGFHFHREGSPLLNRVFIALEKLAGRWTDRLVVINREDRDAARKHGIVPVERLCYMPGIGVDLAHYSPSNVTDLEVAQVRDGIGLPPGAPAFVVIAAFTEGKRHADVVRAFAALNHPDAHLVLVGSGKLEGQTRRLADQLTVGARVHLLGVRRDVPVLLRASVASILVSSREGLPRVVMESLALGTPVIGTRIRGTEELLRGECGLLLPVGDIEALTIAMRWVLDNPEEAREMGRRGRLHMNDYDLGRVIAAHDRLYAELLESRDAKAGLSP